MRPSDKEIARAIRYVVHEFVLHDDRVSLEMLAEGFAFGRVEPDADEIRAAAGVAPEFSADTWHLVTARANWLRAEQGLCPLHERKEGTP